MLRRFFHLRTLFFITAIVLVAGTLLYVRHLSRKIELEERQRVEEWVQANRSMQLSENPASIALANLIMVNMEDMPLIATDSSGRVIDFRNLDSMQLAADSGYLLRQLAALKKEHPPIEWVVRDSPRMAYRVYYGNTVLLNEVQYYPLVQLVLGLLFVAVLVILMRVQSESEQNQVWAGLAKETAHQLGTPVTSLHGWVAMLREQHPESDLVVHLEKDVNRLQLVCDRFGKIGSLPKLEPTDMAALTRDMVAYMRQRATGKVQFSVEAEDGNAVVPASGTLIQWVLENLLKNALDAMSGVGKIDIRIETGEHVVAVEVSDSGKGIPSSHFKRVFEPGFTTNKRGWGLGLTLSKRIVESYHKGRLFVKSSEPGVGTTFRMVLPRANV